jgi:ATP-binding cassette subfamily C protein LapB
LAKRRRPRRKRRPSLWRRAWRSLTWAIDRLAGIEGETLAERAAREAEEGRPAKPPTTHGYDLRAAYLTLARELAPFADARSIATNMGEADHWTIETFVSACEGSGMTARPMFGRLERVLKGGQWTLVEFRTQGWRLVRNLGGNDFMVIPGLYDEAPSPMKASQLETHVTGRAARVGVADASKADETHKSLWPFGHEWFWSTVAEYRSSFAYVVAAGFFVNVLGLAIPLFVMNVYDRVFPNQAFATLWVLAAGVLAAIAFDFTLRLTRARLTDAVGKRVDYRLSTKLFQKIIHAPMTARRESTGAYITRFNEFDFVRDFFTSSTLGAIVDLCFVFIFLIVIWMVGGALVLIPIVGLILVVIAGLVLQAAAARTITRVRFNAAARHNLLFETVSALDAVKALGADRTVAQWWRRLSQANAEANEQMRRFTNIGSAIASTFQQLITVCLIIGGAYQFAAGNMSLGAVIATVLLSNRALAPVGTLALLLARGRQAFQSLNALDQLMALPAEGRVKTVSRPIAKGDLVLKQVNLQLEGAPQNVLTDISMRIPQGTRVGIIGRVGSGKTSLCRLLAALYPPSSGIYTIDDLDARQYNIADVRRAVRVVGAETELFSGTVRDNMILSDPAASTDDLLGAAKLSGLLEFLADGEAGFDRDIGERGAHLSSGQRRILALARALVSPCNVLVLDEPTANLDTWTEARLIERLRAAVRPDQTLIVATHRQAVLDLVDQLVVMDEGRVMMMGPKAQVVAALQQQQQQQSPQRGQHGAPPARS